MEKTEKSKAFSLIEILIVIAIIGVVTGLTFVSMKSSKKHTALRGAQAEVASAIKQAQSYSLQGKIPTTESDVCGYGFQFRNKTRYEIFIYKKNALGDCDPTVQTIVEESQPFAGNAKLRIGGGASTIPAKTSISFDIPNGNATLPALFPGEFIFEIEGDSSGLTKKLLINDRGLVTEIP